MGLRSVINEVFRATRIPQCDRM